MEVEGTVVAVEDEGAGAGGCVCGSVSRTSVLKREEVWYYGQLCTKHCIMHSRDFSRNIISCTPGIFLETLYHAFQGFF